LGRALPGGLGGLGGLGGFGRRKKEQPQEVPANPPGQDQGAQQQSGVLMEMVSEKSNFSTAAVDGSKVAVPAGFQQVEHPMLKR
jgi:hypothetical protein